MSKLFTEVLGRLHEQDKFRKITIDCNKINFFRQTETGTTTVYFDEFCIEVQIDYYEFQQNVMGEILKLEHNADILQLMAGYLANGTTGGIMPGVLIKDCQGIIKQIASDNNSI